MLPSLQGRFKGLSSRRMWSRRPCGPDHIAAFKTAYIHRSQADPTSHNRRPPLTPEYPYPRIGVGVLRECHASTQAHNDAQVQHIAVDLEEPRGLRPTIQWPASGAIRNPTYQLLRIHVLPSWVNTGLWTSRGGVGYLLRRTTTSIPPTFEKTPIGSGSQAYCRMLRPDDAKLAHERKAHYGFEARGGSYSRLRCGSREALLQ